MPNLKQEVVDKHVARVAVSIFLAVEERHELLPYMKRLLIKTIVKNMKDLPEKEIELNLPRLIEGNLFDGETQEKR